MPAWSPVNGRPVRFAPCSPGAKPTISNRAASGPKEGTGALNQLGSRRRHSMRKSFRRGQSGQLRPGLVDEPDTGANASIFEFVVILGAGTSPLGRGAALKELRRVLSSAVIARSACFAGGALGRVAANFRLQFDDVEEDVGLTPQLVGNHRWLGGDRRHH